MLKKTAYLSGTNKIMDMLVVGMNGQGNVALTGCTEDEYKLHFALWAFLQSPLMIGCDIRNMSESTKKILMNKDTIALHQDRACSQAYIASQERLPHPTPNRQPDDPFYSYSEYNLSRSILVRLLDNGDLAAMQINFRDHETWDAPLIITANMLSIPEEKAFKMHVKDLWTGQEISLVNGTIPNHKLGPHSANIYRIHLEN